MWLGVEQTPKRRHVFTRDWTPCSKYGNHSRLNSQRVIEGDLNDHLITEDFHFEEVRDTHISSKNYKANGY